MATVEEIDAQKEIGLMTQEQKEHLLYWFVGWDVEGLLKGIAYVKEAYPNED